MGIKFGNAGGPSQSGTSAAAWDELPTACSSPVAGPDTFLTLDHTGAVGPWQRISYPGSMKGTANGRRGIKRHGYD